MIHEVKGWEDDGDRDDGDPYCDCGAMHTTDEVMCAACGKPVFELMPKPARKSKTADMFDEDAESP